MRAFFSRFRPMWAEGNLITQKRWFCKFSTPKLPTQSGLQIQNFQFFLPTIFDQNRFLYKRLKPIKFFSGFIRGAKCQRFALTSAFRAKCQRCQRFKRNVSVRSAFRQRFICYTLAQNTPPSQTNTTCQRLGHRQFGTSGERG